MGQVFSYIWRCIHRPNTVLETETSQNDLHAHLEEHSHCIIIRDEVSAHPDIVTEDEDEDEDEDEEVIEEVIYIPSLEQGRYDIVADLKNDSVEEEEDEEEEVVVEKVIEEVATTSTSQVVVGMPVKEHGGVSVGERVRRIGSYNSKQTILLVGEGDFSFSTSLAVAFGSASNIIATSLNTQEYLIEHYRKFPIHKRELETRGCTLIHGVDATTMIRHSVLGNLQFDIIIYNFPHTGSFGSSDADLRKNQNLIRGFVRNAKKMINEDGEIHITHKSNYFFGQWDIPKIGCDAGLHLIQEIKFIRTVYPGYCTKYGYRDDSNFNCNPSKTYKFGLRPKSI